MKQELSLQHLRWVKITAPDDHDIQTLETEFRVHPVILREVLVPTVRPKVETYDRHLYMVMHVPVFNKNDRKTYAEEIDCILFENTIITVTYNELRPLEEFWNLANRSHANPHLQQRAGHFLYHMIHHLFTFSLRQLDHIQESINTIEDIIFYGKNESIARDIYLVRRDIIDFRRALRPQEATTQSLIQKSIQLYGDDVRPFFQSLAGEYLRIWDLLENHRETIRELYETNESIVSGNINKTMKVFTVLAFLTFVPNVITNVFSVNVTGIPLENTPDAFWLVIGIATITTFLVYLILKMKQLI